MNHALKIIRGISTYTCTDKEAYFAKTDFLVFTNLKRASSKE